MNKSIDETGNRYGRLTVQKAAKTPTKNGGTRWLCRCDCGNVTISVGSSLRRGRTNSCGCLSHERSSEVNTTHGESKRAEYKVWRSMHRRCREPNRKDWKNYGGRGIKVCKRWDKYENFLADMGRRPSKEYSIDRYPNNDGDYKPSNCRWATRSQQQHNTRMYKGG